MLYQCGTGRPPADVVPEGSKFFQIPLTSVSVIETVPYAYMVSTHDAAHMIGNIIVGQPHHHPTIIDFGYSIVNTMVLSVQPVCLQHRTVATVSNNGWRTCSTTCNVQQDALLLLLHTANIAVTQTHTHTVETSSPFCASVYLTRTYI